MTPKTASGWSDMPRWLESGMAASCALQVMALQTARFLLKGAAGLAQGASAAQLPKSLRFLAERYPAKGVGHAGWQRCALAKRVQWLAKAAIQEVMQHPASGAASRAAAAVADSAHQVALWLRARIAHHGWVETASAFRWLAMAAHRDPCCASFCVQRCRRQLVQRNIVLALAGNKLVFDGAAWNSCTVAAIAAARAFCHYHLLATFEDSLAEAKGLRGAERQALQACGSLWAANLMCEHLGDFMQCGALDGKQARFALSVALQLLALCAPVTMVRAIRFSHGA